MNTNTMHAYDPAKIAPWELPVSDDAHKAYSQLYAYDNAKAFCRRLLQLDRIESFSDQDYENIRTVADGGMWPVPDTVYDQEQWNRDRTLKCAPGQQITQGIYFQMFNVLPPLRLPRNNRTAGYTGGFLVSEPYCCDPNGNGQLYSAFGRIGDRYYYIGLLPVR